MTNVVQFFDDVEVKIVSRSDGILHVEVWDEDNSFRPKMLAVIPFEPDDAIAFGKSLVVDAVNLRDAAEASSLRLEDINAWRDRDGRVWYGKQGSEHMHPKGADTDQADHSWEEVTGTFGPLTPLTDRQAKEQ